MIFVTNPMFLVINENFSQPIKGIHPLGTKGTETSDSGLVYDCTDQAFTFIGCDWWIQQNDFSTIEYPGTVLVLGLGLTAEQWQILETPRPNGYSLDIVAYVTKSYYNGDSENIHVFGGEGIDDLSGIDDADLGIYYRNAYDKTDKIHSLMVLSALMTVARNVKVVFVKLDIKFDTDANGDGGFALYDNQMYDWIINNIETYNIKVMTSSFEKLGKFSNRFKEIKNRGVYLISAIGNDGKLRNSNDYNSYFPSYLSQIRGIGSIDHENRGAVKVVDFIAGIPIEEYVSDYYSKKGSYSGGSIYGQAYCEQEEGKGLETLCSSYGPDEPRGIYYVMPGNGIPLLVSEDNDPTFKFIYSLGTSFSAPLFAGITLIALYAFGQGWRSRTTTSVDYPDVAQIDQIFRHVSSRSSWDIRLGWGYVTIPDLYEYAFSLGQASVPNAGGSPGRFL